MTTTHLWDPNTGTCWRCGRTGDRVNDAGQGMACDGTSNAPGATNARDIIDEARARLGQPPASPDEMQHGIKALNRVLPAAARQHVSDAAWKAIKSRNPWATRDDWEESHSASGTVVLSNAEHDALTAFMRNRQDLDAVNGVLSQQHREAMDAARSRAEAVLRINFAKAAPHYAVIDHLCDALELAQRGDNASRARATAVIELDTENARLRADVQRLAQVANSWQAEAMRYSNNADYWRQRAERKPADGVTRIEPFPEVEPRSDSWPPPSHKPRMLP